MRRAYSDMDFVTDDDKVVGICLGYDFTSEHEWGVEKLKEAFNTGKGYKEGVETSLITQVPESMADGRRFFEYIDKGKDAWIVLTTIWGLTKEEAIKNPAKHFRELNLHGDTAMATAWDDGSFGIRVKGKENKEKLKLIWEAFQNKDICIGLKPGSWVKGSGLTFIFYSCLDKDLKDRILEDQRQQTRLLKAATRTGIEKKLRKAGKRWFALSPRWADNKDESKGVNFFLNPVNQAENYWGEVTVKDLKDWIKGKGKIPNKGKNNDD